VAAVFVELVRHGSHQQGTASDRAAPASPLPSAQIATTGFNSTTYGLFAHQRVINGLAVVLLTLLGAASEAVGYDRMLKTNTSKRRAHSLFRQGRPDPNDARALVTAADAGVYPTARPAAAVLSNSGPRVVALCSYEGVLRGITELAKLQKRLDVRPEDVRQFQQIHVSAE
jgi:hypothetical protein